MHMSHIITCDLPGSTIFFYNILQIARLQKKLLNVICVLISLQLFSETFLILRRTERDIKKHKMAFM
jgi:hypothetical protein